MKTIRRGDEATLIAILDIIQQGCTVSLPFSVAERYDLVIDRKGKLERAQVKRMFRRKGHPSYSLSARSVNSRIIRKYTSDDFEWLIGVIPEEKIVIYYPSSSLAGRSILTFRLQRPKSRMRNRTILVDAYTKLPL